MRRLLILIALIFTISSLSLSQFTLLRTTPPNGTSGVRAYPDSVLVSFKFSKPVDLGRIFGTDSPFPFLSILSSSSFDSIAGVGDLVITPDSVGIWVKLQPNTDYSLALTGAYSTDGEFLNKVYTLTFTTSSSLSPYSVSGQITVPTGKYLNSSSPLSQILNFPEPRFNSTFGKEQNLKKGTTKQLAAEFKLFQNLNKFMQPPKKIMGNADPNFGVVVLSRVNLLKSEQFDARYFGTVNSDFSYQVNYVRNGIYYPFAGFDLNRDGQIDPFNDYILFYDPNGDGEADSIVVNGASVQNVNISGLAVARPFTVREKVDTASALARGFALDSKLKGILTFEGEVDTSFDGKVLGALYIFFSATKGYFGYSVDLLGNITFVPDSLLEIRPTADIPVNFIDSDSVYAIAIRNIGTTQFNFIFYELRNFPYEDAPDTANPYWRVQTTGYTSEGITGWIVYIHPTTGNVVKKFQYRYGSATSREAYQMLDPMAKLYANDAKLKFVLGVDDTINVNGICPVWFFGYESPTRGKFQALYFLGFTRVDSGWMFEFEFPFNLEITDFNALLNSDSVVAIAERNGGYNLRTTDPRFAQIFLLLSQSPFDTTKIYWHVVYADTTGNSLLIVIIDPRTGIVIPTKVEKDRTVEIPREFALYQNYPNPFNPATVIKYDIPRRSEVKLIVYDILGREVATLVNEVQDAGRYSVKFDARNLPSGIYFYRLQAGNFIDMKKMILVK